MDLRHGARLPRRRVALLAVALAMLAPGLQPAGASAAAGAADCAGVPWMDTSKSPDQRARALLAASSLDQKLRWLDEQSANDPTRTTFTTSAPRELPPASSSPSRSRCRRRCRARRPSSTPTRRPPSRARAPA
ncbi:hypothetical protein [Thermocatellispora tengchongensis]|uniref:hypothetical protein n=1 Tax=Thermocatellispora tengchongensis TaxID=1073253 RepID=UPI00363D803C